MTQTLDARELAPRGRGRTGPPGSAPASASPSIVLIATGFARRRGHRDDDRVAAGATSPPSTPGPGWPGPSPAACRVAGPAALPALRRHAHRPRAGRRRSPAISWPRPPGWPRPSTSRSAWRPGCRPAPRRCGWPTTAPPTPRPDRAQRPAGAQLLRRARGLRRCSWSRSASPAGSRGGCPAGRSGRRSPSASRSRPACRGAAADLTDLVRAARPGSGSWRCRSSTCSGTRCPRSAPVRVSGSPSAAATAPPCRHVHSG